MARRWMGSLWMAGVWGLVGFLTGCGEAVYSDVDGDGCFECQGRLCPSVGLDPSSAEQNGCTPTEPPVVTSEICDGEDNDGDGLIDEDQLTEEAWPDADGDGYGDENGTPISVCADQDPEDGYVKDNTDCDDENKTVNTNGVELCDDQNLDEDCDGGADDADPEASVISNLSIWYTDADEDGYGDGDTTASGEKRCDAEDGQVSENGDCDDTDDAIHPDADESVCDGEDSDCDGAVDEDGEEHDWYYDADLDGYGSNNSKDFLRQCADPNEDLDPQSTGQYVQQSGDCEDNNAAINPAAQEVCSALYSDRADENCDDLVDVDDDSLETSITWYKDNDNDNFGVEGGEIPGCSYSDYDPPGWAEEPGDCNDSNSSVYPGAPEVCDGIDNDCDGDVDDKDDNYVDQKQTWYPDNDKDGYGAENGTSLESCEKPDGYVADNTDCNDTAATIFPSAAEITGDEVDQNCDGKETCYFDADDDGYLDNQGLAIYPSEDEDCRDAKEGTKDEHSTKDDCNDFNAAVNPGVEEVCDSADVDEDCDGKADDADEQAASIANHTPWYCDSDGDSYGTPNDTKQACDKPSGYVNNSKDCNDTKADIKPGATELTGDSIDQNCDGKETCYTDNDNDGSAISTPLISDNSSCTDTGEGTKNELSSPNGPDCDDTNSTIKPGVAEVAGDSADQNCNGAEDCYKDADNDGYRPDTSSTVASEDTDCSDDNEATSSDPTTDCDDANPQINPNATEVCDVKNANEDCDSGADDKDPQATAISNRGTWYRDGDRDNYGSNTSSTQACDQPSGYVSIGGDCNDNDSTINPGATELTGDSIDQNCDGNETCYTDADNDGSAISTTLVSDNSSCTDTGEGTKNELSSPNGPDCNDTNSTIKPGATEACNGLDDDCDGTVDDGITIPTWYQDSDGDTYGSASTQSCTQPADYVSTPGDCDDGKADIYPGATEACNGLDDDCDKVRDDGAKHSDGTDFTLITAQWFDGDTDGYGGPVCAIPAGGSPSSKRGDCDDSDAQKYPGSTTSGKDCCQRPNSGTAAYVCIGASPNYTTLNDAHSKATDGGQIWVMSPTATGSVYTNSAALILNKNISIFGIEPGKATLRAAQNGRVFTNESKTVTVDGVNLTGYGSLNNGGLVSLSGGTTLIQNSTLSNGNVTGGGGAIYISGGSLTLTNAWVKDNKAGGNGGAVYATGGTTLTLTDVTFSGNSAVSSGGALFLINSGTSGDYKIQLSNVWLKDNYVSGYTDRGTFYPGDGAAIRAEGQYLSLDLQNVRVEHNYATGKGGGISLGAKATLTAENLILYNNYAASHRGGALSIESEAAATLKFTAVVGNGAKVGSCGTGADRTIDAGAIWVEGKDSSVYSKLTLSHSILSGNFADPTITGTVGANSSWSQTGQANGQTVQVNAAGYNVVATSNCGNTPPPAENFSLTYFDGYLSDACTSDTVNCYGLSVTGLSKGTGWLNVLPIFTSSYTGDLHMTSGNSSLINVGSCTENDPDGTACDLGPYGGPGADLWDLDLDGYPDWFWPGTWSSPPSGFSNIYFDFNDLDSTIPAQ